MDTYAGHSAWKYPPIAVLVITRTIEPSCLLADIVTVASKVRCPGLEQQVIAIPKAWQSDAAWQFC
jgi:hypothetical protein